MITAIVQARRGSTRLPDKVMKTVLGKTLLSHLVQRLRASRTLEAIVIATTALPEDDAIAELAGELGVPVTRGSVEDVLDRFAQAARAHNASAVVRITADCPLMDPAVLDRVVRRYLELGANVDYVSNTLTPTYPDGLDVEVFSRAALERTHKEAGKKYQREHVCPYIVENPQTFRLENVSCGKDLSGLRWTVDTARDFEFVQAVFERLYPSKPLFGMEDVLDLLSREPGLGRLNEGILRNEGFVRSVDSENLSRDERERILKTVIKRPT